MATNILGLMDYVQQQGDKGRQQGQQQSFNRLAGQAYTAPTAQQGALVGQMVGIDPQAGMAVDRQLQANETDHMKKLGGAARYMAQALQSKNPQQIQGAWSAVRPYLAELTGQQPPEQWDPSFESGVYKAIAMTGGDPEQRGVVLSQGAQLRNPMNGALLADNPLALKYQNVPTGEGKVAGVFDPSTGALRPAAVGAAPGGQAPAPGVTPEQLMAQATQMANEGGPGAHAQEAEAWLRQQLRALGEMTPASPGLPGQFGVGTPAGPKPQNETWNQPVDETGPDGKPIRVQYSNTGERRVVSGALPATKAADAKLQMQARAAKSNLSGTIAQLDRLEQAAQQLRSDPGLGGITGVRGHVPDIPGSDAARARAMLETLKSQVGFGVLQQMREMSKTGGALGSVSDRENSLLQNNLAALGTNQSAEDFQRALDQVVAYARDSKARLQGAYRDTYGEDGSKVSSQPSSSGVDDLLSKYGVH